MTEREAVELFFDTAEMVIEILVKQRTDIDEDTRQYVIERMRKARDCKKGEEDAKS